MFEGDAIMHQPRTNASQPRPATHLFRVSRSTCRFSSDIIQGLLNAVLIRGNHEDTLKGRSGVYESGVGRMGFIGSVLGDALILL